MKNIILTGLLALSLSPLSAQENAKKLPLPPSATEEAANVEEATTPVLSEEETEVVQQEMQLCCDCGCGDKDKK